MTELSVWNAILAIAAGYLIGSFPTGVIVARIMEADDPRTAGSGHTGGSNILRTMGWPAAVITGAVDIAKGALAVWLVMQIVDSPWVIPLTGAAAVAGHCWPIFTGYRGGMGIATAAGLAAWFFPLLIPIYAAFFFLLNRFLEHPARSAMLISALIPLILLALQVETPQLALGAGMSFILIIRFAGDFYREYE